MNIKPYDKTIRDLLGSKRQFLIPRFQREYSWEKKNYREFFEDMMGNLTITDGKISASQYFLGTMLFIGNFTEGTDQVIQVVDGQQRLTTITILFSALSDRFTDLGEKTLSRQIFTYIMTEDADDGTLRADVAHALGQAVRLNLEHLLVACLLLLGLRQEGEGIDHAVEGRALQRIGHLHLDDRILRARLIDAERGVALTLELQQLDIHIGYDELLLEREALRLGH